MLTQIMDRLEASCGGDVDWTPSGVNPQSAAYDLARTICRRAERNVVRFGEAGGFVQPQIMPYLNRLSDVLWLFVRDDRTVRRGRS